jgi:hypothetical protein
LNAIFPDASFVHLVREGREVAASSLRRGRREAESSNWWGAKPPGWQNMLSEPTIVQSAWMWEQCLRIGRQSARQLEPHRYHELSYEALTESPEETLRDLLQAVELSDNNFFTAEIRAYLETLENRNERWTEELTAEDQKLLLRQLEQSEVP